jgi:hypothetical protein
MRENERQGDEQDRRIVSVSGAGGLGNLPKSGVGPQDRHRFVLLSISSWFSTANFRAIPGRSFRGNDPRGPRAGRLGHDRDILRVLIETAEIVPDRVRVEYHDNCPRFCQKKASKYGDFHLCWRGQSPEVAIVHCADRPRRSPIVPGRRTISRTKNHSRMKISIPALRTMFPHKEQCSWTKNNLTSRREFHR